mmetsp:Transcript_47836/g.113890  ORF Transcript_47836/g.113890 Transcript_47836/m.113890 type:complete len:171 (-) Transcript_47836:492-1004(-)
MSTFESLAECRYRARRPRRVSTLRPEAAPDVDLSRLKTAPNVDIARLEAAPNVGLELRGRSGCRHRAQKPRRLSTFRWRLSGMALEPLKELEPLDPLEPLKRLSEVGPPRDGAEEGKKDDGKEDDDVGNGEEGKEEEEKGSKRLDVPSGEEEEEEKAALPCVLARCARGT